MYVSMLYQNQSKQKLVEQNNQISARSTENCKESIPSKKAKTHDNNYITIKKMEEASTAQHNTRKRSMRI